MQLCADVTDVTAVDWNRSDEAIFEFRMNANNLLQHHRQNGNNFAALF